jgi:hypothetical protein
MLMNGSVHTRPNEFERVLVEKGEQEFVEKLVQVFASRLSKSKDLRLFRHLRLMYAGAKHVEVDRLFVPEMSKELPDDMQRLLLKELPRSYRREVEIWRNAPWWERLLSRLAK